jgi:hypothetical protein
LDTGENRSEIPWKSRNEVLRRKESIRCSDLVQREILLYRFDEKKNILHTIKTGKVNWVSHISSGKCLLKLDIAGKI